MDALWWILFFLRPWAGLIGAILCLVTAFILFFSKQPSHQHSRRSSIITLLVLASILGSSNIVYYRNNDPEIQKQQLRDRRLAQEKAIADSITFPLYSSGALDGIQPVYDYVDKHNVTYLISAYKRTGAKKSFVSIYQYQPGKVPYTIRAVDERACSDGAQYPCVKIRDTQYGPLYEVRYEHKNKFYFIRGEETNVLIETEDPTYIDSLLDSMRASNIPGFGIVPT